MPLCPGQEVEQRLKKLTSPVRVVEVLICHLTSSNYPCSITAVVLTWHGAIGMASKRVFRLGDLQLRIMRVLWSHGPANVATVQKKLAGEPLAYTTVATMLRKMEDRGLVCHREEERRFIYESAVGQDEVTRSMADDLVSRLFQGSLADTVSHLLDSRDVSPSELAQLEQLIKERKKRRRD